jgi:hypothetical protein
LSPPSPPRPSCKNPAKLSRTSHFAFKDPGAFFPVLAFATTLVPDPADPLLPDDVAIPLLAEAVNDIALAFLELFVAFESDVSNDT